MILILLALINLCSSYELMSTMSLSSSPSSSLSSSSTSSQNTTKKSMENSLRRSIFLNDSDTNQIRFIISKADYEDSVNIDYKNIPIVLPADAFLTSSETEDKKMKNNFSKIAKNLVAKNQHDNNQTDKFTRSLTTTSTSRIATTLIDVLTFCVMKTDGLYSDPSDCESFVICFANRTFKTKCAFGTLWNHEKMQCDFAEKVDCTRSTTVITTTIETTTTTTTIKTTTLVKKPKLFVVTSILRKQKLISNKTKKNLNLGKPNLLKPIEPMTSTLTNNIIIASIIIPAVILLIVSIILTLWYWKKKFKLQAQKLHANKLMTNRNTSNNNVAGLPCESKRDDLNLLRKVSSLSLLKKFSKLASKHGQFSPKMIQKEEQISSQTNETSLTKDANSQTNLPFENAGFIKEDPNSSERLVLSENKTLDQINMTNLSSQFDENHWDYNIGSRALYLSQPWVKARYIHTLGSESMVTSGVLTLDPTIDLGAEINKIIETGSESVTESEGYYA